MSKKCPKCGSRNIQYVLSEREVLYKKKQGFLRWLLFFPLILLRKAVDIIINIIIGFIYFPLYILRKMSKNDLKVKRVRESVMICQDCGYVEK